MRQYLKTDFALLRKLNFRLFFFLEADCTAELGCVTTASALRRASWNLHKVPWALTGRTGEAELTRAKASSQSQHSEIPPRRHYPYSGDTPECSLQAFYGCFSQQNSRKAIAERSYSVLTFKDCTFIFLHTDWFCFSKSCLASFDVVVYTVFLGKL